MTVDPKTQQRFDALAKAQEIRLGKAALKREFAAGDQAKVLRRIAKMLADPSCRRLDSFKIVELLISVPGVGKTKAQSISRSADWVELTFKVSRLTERQRKLLARVLKDRAEEVEQRVSQAA